MPKSTAPFEAPEGKKWCSAHNKGKGAFLSVIVFPGEGKYSYCRDCKRAYQRVWDRTKRVRPVSAVEPMARLSKDNSRIIVHLPNTEKGRNVTRQFLTYWPDVEVEW